MILTEYSANLEQLTPASDGAAGTTFGLRGRKTHRSYVVAECQRSLKPQQSDVVDEAVVHVFWV